MHHAFWVQVLCSTTDFRILEPIPLGVQVHDEQVATDNYKSKEEDSQARGAAGVGPFLAIPPKGTGARIS